MNELEKLLDETSYTEEEYKIYCKIQKHFYLLDLEQYIEEQLDSEYITKERAEQIKENASAIISRYDKTLDYDWRETMDYAVEWACE